jgi:uncharacterized membrane protein YraQ (UPF0718 family)
MEFILGLVTKSVEQVLLSLQHNWLYLILSVIIATLLKLYVDSEKVSTFLNRNRGKGVVAATVAAVATPLCSCGTTAVVLGMMASTMPWAPIVAFMVASPLSSPEGLVYSAGIFGWPFALAFYLASIVLGLVGGWIAAVVESRGWLANQTRFPQVATAPCACSANIKDVTPNRIYSLEVPVVTLNDPKSICGCSGGAVTPAKPATSCGCGQANAVASNAGCTCNTSSPVQENSQAGPQKPKVTLVTFLKELYSGGKRLLGMFLGFAFIGYFLNGLIPSSWVSAVFGGSSLYNVPLAATLGLPLYINSEASLPLVRALIDNGMSQGAALAFLISGSGTSIGAITGALTIARWRVVALVVGILWVGAILCGLAFNLVLALA